MKERVVYYTDELNNDFAGMNMKKVKLKENFKYLHKSFIWRVISFVLYRIIATPVAYLTCKLYYGIKYINRKAMKSCKGGRFLYINHTMVAGDAYNPSIVAFPHKTHIIVGTEAVSKRGLDVIVPMLGGIPLPGGIKQTAEFKSAIEYLTVKRGDCVTIYPEAHIWKYYNRIRPFKDVSFRYPAELMMPSFAATVVYRKRRFCKRPRADVYVDGPFYPDATLPIKERKKKLRDEIYAVMCKRAEGSDCEYIKYVKREAGGQQTP